TTFLSLVASALWIYTLSMYTRKIASAGGYYTFNYGAWRSKKFAFLEALTEAVAYILLNAVNVIAIYSILSVTSNLLNIHIPTWVLYLSLFLAVIYPTIASLIDIRKLLGYIVTISATAEAILLIVLFLLSLSNGFHLDYFLPKFRSPGDLATAFVLTTVSISGAGASTYLGEETKDPHKNVTKGMWLALIIGGASMFLGTYGIIALWSGALTNITSTPQPLFVEMIRYGSIALFISLILSINSLLSSNIGTTVGSARILYNLARENAAPSIFRRLNQKGEPLFATVIAGVATGVITIVSINLLGFQSALNEIAAVEGILWLLGRIFDGFGAPIFYWRIGNLKLGYVIIPVIATLINSWGDIQSILSMDMVQIFSLASFGVLTVVWYALKASKGNPGSLVVDENNKVITIDEYLKKVVSR
ncbi:amino acid permease, partial [Sulfolobus sp. F1]